ncbi:MAG: hypothetical protein V5A43_11980 [Haloarculaceae archaeon]
MSHATETGETATARLAERSDGLAGLTVLPYWVVKKRFLLLVRYPLNTLAQFVSVSLFFSVVFFGGQAAAGSLQAGGAAALGGTVDGLIVGWFLWTMCLIAYFNLVMTATNEAQWGTLEQLAFTYAGRVARSRGVLGHY